MTLPAHRATYRPFAATPAAQGCGPKVYGPATHAQALYDTELAAWLRECCPPIQLELIAA